MIFSIWEQLIISLEYLDNIWCIIQNKFLNNINYLINIDNINNLNKGNFKIKINNYILEDKIIYWNIKGDQHYWNIIEEQQQTFEYKINNIYIFIEKILILIQKIFLEYKDYIWSTKYWYGNSKILMNKGEIWSNTSSMLIKYIPQDEATNNINFHLLIDVQKENLKHVTFLLKHHENLLHINQVYKTKRLNNEKYNYNLPAGKFLLKNLYIKYLFAFNENPYKIIRVLKKLYKPYSNSILLNYGIDYDINVVKTMYTQQAMKKGKMLNEIIKPYLKGTNHFQNIDLIQPYFRKFTTEKMLTKFNFEQKRNRIMLIDAKANWEETVKKLLTDIADKKGVIIPYELWQQNVNTYYMIPYWLDLISLYTKNYTNEMTKIINEYKSTIAIEQMPNFDLKVWSNKKSWPEVHNPHLYDNIFPEMNASKNQFEEDDNYLPRYQSFYETINDDAGRLNYSRMRFGGYTYWWSWHQDAFFLYGKKGSGGALQWRRWFEVRKWKTDFKKIFWYYRRYHTTIRHGFTIKTSKYGRWYKKYHILSPFERIDGKKKKIKQLYHGRFSWKLEKKYFKYWLKNWYMLEFTKLKLKTSRGKEGNHLRLFGRRTYRFNKNDMYGFIHFRSKRPRTGIWFRSSRVVNRHGFGIRFKKTLYKRAYIASLPWFSCKYDHKIPNWTPKLQSRLSFLEIVVKRFEKFASFKKEFRIKPLNNARYYLMKKYAWEVYMNNKELILKEKIINNKYTFESFLTSIENVKDDDLNLNYINKNIYGRHAILNEQFIVKEPLIYSRYYLPVNKNILIKKYYFENLINVYENEEEPIKNYIKYKRTSMQILNEYIMFYNKSMQLISNIIHNIIFNFFIDYKIFYNVFFEHFKDLWLEFIKTNKYHQVLKDYYKYIWKIIIIMIICTLYSGISILLMLLIKSYLPNKLIYGIKQKNFWTVKKDGIFKKHYKKRFFVKRTLMYPMEDFLNVEHDYIYRWTNRNKLYKFMYDFKSKHIISEQEQKNIRKKGKIVYETFRFEKNLEKLENNTKIRFHILIWVKHFGLGLLGLLNIWYIYYRDRKYNHNRAVFWSDSTLEKDSKLSFYIQMPKIFINYLFVVRMFFTIFQTLNFRFWYVRLQQMYYHGVSARINYKDHAKYIEKDTILDWYKNTIDFGAGLLYADIEDVAQRFDDIKNYIAPAEQWKQNRNRILSNIIKKALKEKELQKTISFRKDIDRIREKRYLSRKDVHYENIREQLKFEVNKISDKEWAEQELMYEYRELVQEKKKKLEREFAKLYKDSFYKSTQAGADDDWKNRRYIEYSNYQNTQVYRDHLLWTTEFERLLREENFEKKKIDRALDRKDRPFFEEIPEYNQALSDAWLNIAIEEKEKEEETTNFQKFNKMLHHNIENNFTLYRRWATIGARFYYVCLSVVALFNIWLEHIQRIRKNNYSLEALYAVTKTEMGEYIYKIYIEYNIIWQKHKIVKNFGYRIIDMLKFSLLILTPLAILTGSLYILLIFYGVMKIKINERSKKPKKGKINKIINILILIFKAKPTEETFLAYSNKALYKLCSWFQKNIYYFQGAFKIGYNQNGLMLGINKVLKLLYYKYKVFINIEKNKITLKIKYNWENIKLWFSIEDKMNINVAKISIKLLIFWTLWKKWIIFWHIIYVEILQITEHNKYIAHVVNSKKSVIIIALWFKEQYWSFFKKFINIFNRFKNLTLKEKIIISLQLLLIVLFSIPKTLWKQYRKFLRIEDYKGVQGVIGHSLWGNKQENDSEKHEHNWQWIYHLKVINRELSTYLKDFWNRFPYNQIQRLLDIRVFSLSGTKIKDTEQFWKEKNWHFREFKEKVHTDLIAFVVYLEDLYIEITKNYDTKKASFLYTVWMSYIWHLRSGIYDKKIQKRIHKNASRDIFFFNKVKDRRKTIRKYLIKSLINLLTYILIKKVIFKKVKKLGRHKVRGKKRKYKYLKYNLSKESEDYHVGTHLDKTPPQLWFLIMMFDLYCKNLFRYCYSDDESFPIKWSSDLEDTIGYKWRLAEDACMADMVSKAYIGIAKLTLETTDLDQALNSKPYDPLLRWGLFLLEFQFAEEVPFGTKEKHETWGDISLAQLLTYDEENNKLLYEIKPSELKIEHYSYLGYAEWKLEKAKNDEYNFNYHYMQELFKSKSEDLLEHVLHARRNRSAQALHKAWLHYKHKTADDIEMERVINQSKDYFYVKRRDIFTSNDMIKYLDWEEEKLSGDLEEIYYNNNDLEEVKREEEPVMFWLSKDGDKSDYYTGPKIDPYLYLKNTLLLSSYDFTFEEMLNFSKNEWTDLLNKQRNKKNKKNQQEEQKYVIHYKHINVIGPSILLNMNSTEHHKVLTTREYNDIYTAIYGSHWHKTKSKLLYLYIYKPYLQIEGHALRYDPLYGFIENNLLLLYYYYGRSRTYNDRIKYHAEAAEYYKIDNYFEMDYMTDWVDRILNRRFKNIIDDPDERYGSIGSEFEVDDFSISDSEDEYYEVLHRREPKKRMISLFPKVYNNPARFKHNENWKYGRLYVNSIRWSWAQWIGMEDTEKEDQKLNNNIIVLNEKYSLWNLRRLPIRGKLPVKLVIPKDTLEFYKKMYTIDYNNFLRTADRRLFSFAGSISGAVGASLTFRRWRVRMEERYNMQFVDLMYWILGSPQHDMETIHIMQNNEEILKDFTANFTVFNKVFFSGFIQNTWDYFRYYELFCDDEDFPIEDLLVLKRIEFLAEDPHMQKEMELLDNIAFTKYDPIAYYRFFWQRHYRFAYRIHNICSYIFLIWFIEIVFFHPGIYVIYYPMLWIPVFLSLMFWFIKKMVKTERDLEDGKELYLYKYQTNEKMKDEDVQAEYQKEEKKNKVKREFFKIVDIDGIDDLQEVYGIKQEKIINSWSRDGYWWKKNSHNISRNKTYQYYQLRHMIIRTLLFLNIPEFWDVIDRTLRNFKYFWQFYNFSEVWGFAYIDNTPLHKRSWWTRTWVDDCWTRLEAGGNIYSVWYTNKYRIFQYKELQKLDASRPEQIVVQETFMDFMYNKILIIEGSYSDVSWWDMCWQMAHHKPPTKTYSDGSAYRSTLNKLFLNKELWWKYIEYEDISQELTEDMVRERGVVKWFKKLFKASYIEWIVNKYLHFRFHIKGYHAILEYMKFKNEMLEKYDYNLTENDWYVFLFKSIERTFILIKTDRNRYLGNSIYKSTPILQKNTEVISMHKDYFHNNKKSWFNHDILLSLTKVEKHLHLLNYKFLKYRKMRFQLLFNSPNFPKRFRIPKLSDLPITDKKSVRIKKPLRLCSKRHWDIRVDVTYFNPTRRRMLYVNNLWKQWQKTNINLSKYETYIKKLFQKITYKEHINYNLKLMVKALKEKKVRLFGELFMEYSNIQFRTLTEYLGEFFDILVKFFENI